VPQANLVRCSSDNSHKRGEAILTLRANSRRMRCSKVVPWVAMIYSITSSAVICMISGTVRPSVLKVFKLIASSYFVGC
jgi:hypothetical protein